MARSRRIGSGLGLAALVAAIVTTIVTTVVPAAACSYPGPTLQVPATVTAGSTVRVEGTEWRTLDPDPPVTTTTTTPGGGIVAECSPTITARSLHLTFVQHGQATDLGIFPVRVDETFGAVVVIPASADAGPAQIVARTQDVANEVVADVTVRRAGPPVAEPAFTG